MPKRTPRPDFWPLAAPGGTIFGLSWAWVPGAWSGQLRGEGSTNYQKHGLYIFQYPSRGALDLGEPGRDPDGATESQPQASHDSYQPGDLVCNLSIPLRSEAFVIPQSMRDCLLVLLVKQTLL